jgi:AraC family transcriptional regulator
MLLKAGEFLGNAVRVHEWGGLTLSEHAYPAHARLPRHEHRRAYLSVPVSGSYEERWGTRRTSCSSSVAVFHPSGEEHADLFHGAEARVLSIEVDEGWCEHLRDAGARVSERIELRGSTFARGAARLRHMLSLRDHPPVLRIEACTIDLLAELPSRGDETRAPRWLVTVIERIHDARPARPSMSDLSRAAGVHPVHLARTFRRVHGRTIGEYVRSLRLEQAMELLRGRDPIGEVALAAGFSDQSHLCRELKRAIGVTPKEFRARR